MNALQLELFEPNDEISLLHREIAQMRISLDKQRKSQFAKINDLSKELIALKEELYKIKFRTGHELSI